MHWAYPGRCITSRLPGRPELAARGREIFETDPLLIGEVGPVIGTHVGPGLLGVGGVPKRLLEAVQV